MPDTAADLEATSALRVHGDPALLHELVAHLAANRGPLRDEWVRRILEARLLSAVSREEVFAEATSLYDSYVEALETRTLETLEAYAQRLSERSIPRGVETHEVVGLVLLLLRDMRLDRLAFGHGRNRGFGRVRLVELGLKGLTPGDSVVGREVGGSSIGGFCRFELPMAFDDDGYPQPAHSEVLTSAFREAVAACRAVIRAGRARVD